MSMLTLNKIHVGSSALPNGQNIAKHVYTVYNSCAYLLNCLWEDSSLYIIVRVFSWENSKCGIRLQCIVFCMYLYI